MKGFIKIALCVIFAVAVSGNVYAKDVPTIFMTDLQGSYVERDPPHIFQLTETPWVSVDMQDNSIVSGTWELSGNSPTFNFTSLAFSNTGASYTNGDFTFFNSSTTDRTWVSLTNWLTGVGVPGEWHINGAVKLDGSPVDGHSINYKVEVPNTVPEPVATVLFMIGGATLAVRRLRKGRKA